MDYLLEIIESDGNSVGSGDDGAVVTAALEEWGFLATQLEDMEDTTEEAMEAFVEQLDSSEPSVQIAAGENIALLYEKSYTEAEEDEEVESEDDEDPEDETSRDGPKMIKRYEPYRRLDKLRHTLSDLASISSRRLSKKDRKSLHTNFSDILNSVENPTRGPRYQNAVNQETGKRYGSRMTIRIHRSGVMKIDKWWKLHRLQALRRILAGGFVTHYEKNEVVFESLPYVQADAITVF
jgi:Interferon-related developmental regulator (IFRD)